MAIRQSTAKTTKAWALRQMSDVCNVARQMYQQLYKASPVTCHAYMMEVARRVATEQGPAAADDVKLKLVSSIECQTYTCHVATTPA